MSPRRGRRSGAGPHRGDPPGQAGASPSSALTESSDPHLWLIGRIGRAVGLQGEFNLHPVSNDPEDLERVLKAPARLASPQVDPADQPATSWRGLRWQGARAVGAMEGIDSREDAEARVHWQVWVDRRDLPPLVEGRHWIDDLIGCTVIQVETEDAPREEIGRVAQVISGAAQDQLEVEMSGGRKAMIPFVDPFLVNVCTEEHRIEVDLPDGLLDV